MKSFLIKKSKEKLKEHGPSNYPSDNGKVRTKEYYKTKKKLLPEQACNS